MLDHSSMMFPETAHFSGRVVHMPIAIITLNPIDLRDVDDRFHSVLDRTLTDLEELLYQGQ